MSRKVKTIRWDAEAEFDRMVNEFIAKDYVHVENITFNSTTASYGGGLLAAFIAHIEYIDVRE